MDFLRGADAAGGDRHQYLAGARLGHERRNGPRACKLSSALQSNDRYARQSLEIQTDFGVGSHGCIRHHRDDGIDAARIVCGKAKTCNFSDTNAVEQHRRAHQQPRHRAVELHVIRFPRSQPAGVVKPVNKAENCANGRQNEGPDNHEGSSRFHVSSFSVAASGSACRGNRLSPRDARSEAVRSWVRSPRSCRRRAQRPDHRQC